MKTSTRVLARGQTGFTLIELIIVMVVIGILAAVAIPKFTDLSAEAQKAKANGYAGAIASASAANYAKKLAGGSYDTVTACSAIPSSWVVPAIVSADFPITAGTTAPANGAAGDCKLGYPSMPTGGEVIVTVIGAS